MVNRHVNITHPLLLRVERKESSDACHIASMGHVHKDLSIGQLVVGASHNNSNKSFLKMPSNLVQQELARLEQQRQPYALIVSDLSTLVVPNDQGVANGHAQSPTHPNTMPVPNQATSQSSQSAMDAPEHKSDSVPPQPFSNGHQYVMHTPPPGAVNNNNNHHQQQSHRGPGFSTPQQYNNNNMNNDDNNNNNKIHGHEYSEMWPMTGGEEDSTESDVDLSAARAAVDRLRQQRIEAERMRKDFRQNESMSRNLTTENQDLRSKVSALHEMIDAQNNLLAELTVSEEKVKTLKDQEDQLTDQLRQDHEDREKERLDHTNQLADLRKQVATLQVKNNEDSLSSGEIRADLENVRSEADSLRTANRHLEQRVTQISKLHEKEMVQVSRERDVLQRRVQELDDALQSTRNELVYTQDELGMSQGREVMLRETCQESEHTMTALRTQLEDTKRVNSEAVSDLSKSLSDATTALREERVKSMSLKAQVDKSKQRAHEEMESHRFSRDLLMKKGDEVNKLAAEVFRAQQGETKLKEQLKNTSARMEDNHKRLLEEMAKGSNATQKLEQERNSARAWVRERSKLLAQFCDEEQRLRQVTWSLRSDMQRSNRGVVQSGSSMTMLANVGGGGGMAATARAHQHYAGASPTQWSAGNGGGIYGHGGMGGAATVAGVYAGAAAGGGGMNSSGALQAQRRQNLKHFHHHPSPVPFVGLERSSSEDANIADGSTTD